MIASPPLVQTLKMSRSIGAPSEWSAPDGTCFSGQINLAVSMARGKGEDTTNSTCHAPTANPTSVEGNRIDRKPYIWIEICEEPVDFP